MTQPPMTPNYQMQPQGSSGLSMASFVLGIIAIVLTIVLFCFPFLGGVLGLVAVILGAIAMSQSTPAAIAGKGKAKTGLVLGIISILLAVGIIVAANVGVRFLNKKGPQWQQQLQQKADEMKKEADDAQKKAMEDQQKMQNQTQPSSSAAWPVRVRPALAWGGPAAQV
jgi:membrane-bound ClpP family serine protease